MMTSFPDPFEPFRSKYDVHSECDDFIKTAATLQLQPYTSLTVEEARKQSNRVGKSVNGHISFDGDISEQVISSPTIPGAIPITIYKPAPMKSDKPAILIYFHGGGLVIGSLDTHDGAMRIIAQKSGAIVIFVSYRLLPSETNKTAPFDDATIAVKWVLDNRKSVSGHADSKVGVGGDSAGGHLTTSVMNEIEPGRIDFQILVYPMTDISRKHDSFREFEMCPGLTKASIDWFFENSIAQIPDAISNPRINPIARKNIHLSPPALMIVAEMDALRDVGTEYAKKLIESGVDVKLEVISGVPHAFFQLPGVFKASCEYAYETVATFIQRFQ